MKCDVDIRKDLYADTVMSLAPPCTQVLPTECKRKSLPWLHPPSRSKSLLRLRENTPYGSEDPSWLPSPPSNRCGSPSKNTTNAAHPLSTENASKLYLYFCYLFYQLVLLYTCCLKLISMLIHTFQK